MREFIFAVPVGHEIILALLRRYQSRVFDTTHSQTLAWFVFHHNLNTKPQLVFALLSAALRV